jgi:hypothetical protein
LGIHLAHPLARDPSIWSDDPILAPSAAWLIDCNSHEPHQGEAGERDIRGLLLLRRRLSVVATLAVAAATLGMSPVMAGASGRAPDTIGLGPHAVSASQMTLAQAPMGLRVAVRSVGGGSQ